MTRYAMVIDIDRCVGCQACTIACKTENGTPADVWYAPVIEYEMGVFPDARMVFLPVLCNHCQDAPCVQACPTGALEKRPDGIVDYHQEACCGTRACLNACPYGALHINGGGFGESLYDGGRSEKTVSDHTAFSKYQSGAVMKCTFCVQRVDYGNEHGLVPGVDPQATPACVVTCPAECRIFGDLDDETSPVSRYLAERGPGEVLRPDAQTGAHVFYVGGV